MTDSYTRVVLDVLDELDKLGVDLGINISIEQQLKALGWTPPVGVYICGRCGRPFPRDDRRRYCPECGPIANAERKAARQRGRYWEDGKKRQRKSKYSEVPHE